MAYQVAQVFYVVDPTSEYWHVMLHGKRRPTMNMNKPLFKAIMKVVGMR